MLRALQSGSRVTFEETSLPPAASGQVKIRVEACGVCGTDLHENPNAPTTPKPFGHEVAGIITELGSPACGLRLGQRVAIESSTPCGHCADCHNARQEHCRHLKSFFHLGSLGFAEEALVPEVSALPADDLPADVASLSEPLGVAIDLVRLAEIVPGQDVLLMGPGAIGLMALALVKRAGARRIYVAGTSRRPKRNELARACGATEIIETDLRPLTEYKFAAPLDRILVTTPPATLAEAFAVAGRGAIISFIGIAHGEGAFCRFNVNDFHFKKLQLRASYASPALYTPLALDYLREGVVDGPALISHRFPLRETEKALETARRDPTAIKVVVTA